MTFDQLQTEVGAWAQRNFGDQPADNPLLGVVEEVGELAHAVLKRKQGIRGTDEQHLAAERDAIGDILIYLADYCGRRGFTLDAIVTDTWATVSKRDWTKNKQTGA